MWTPAKTTHKQFVEECMKDPEFKKEYDALEDEFSILNSAIAARKAQKLSQSDIARKMGLPRSAVCKLERGLVEGKMPTLSMLKRYAQALGKRVEVRLV